MVPTVRNDITYTYRPLRICHMLCLWAWGHICNPGLRAVIGLEAHVLSYWVMCTVLERWNQENTLSEIKQPKYNSLFLACSRRRRRPPLPRVSPVPNSSYRGSTRTSHLVQEPFCRTALRVSGTETLSSWRNWSWRHHLPPPPPLYLCPQFHRFQQPQAHHHLHQSNTVPEGRNHQC